MAPQKKKHTPAQISGLLGSQHLKECPSCKEQRAKVKESRRVFEGVRRRYACLACNYRFTAYEIDSSVYEELRSLRSKFSQLQQIFGEVSPPLQEVQLAPEPVPIESTNKIPCGDCTHMSSYGCSFDIPEAQTEDAFGCNLFQPAVSDNILT